MKKSSRFDFTVPQRQSYIAILLILLKRGKVLLQQLIPLMVVVWLGGKKGGLYFVGVITLVVLFSLVYSIINFFRTSFYITDDEIILNTGILNRKKLSIRLDKIQTVNFEQNIIHRVFEVYRIKIDTAGSSKEEFEFQALDIDKAKAIQDLVIDTRSRSKQSGPLHEEDNSINLDNQRLATHQQGVSILKLTPLQLLKVGLTENHIRSFGVIIAFFIYWYQNLKDVGIDMDGYSKEIDYQTFMENFILFSFVFILVIAILISVVRSVIKYYDLQFIRNTNGFKIISGLFTKREVAAQDTKIQYIIWSQNLLQKYVNFFQLTLSQASSSKNSRQQTISIPGLTDVNINAIAISLFGQSSFDSEDKNYKVDPAYFRRFTQWLLAILLIACAISYYLQSLDELLFFAIVIAITVLNRYLKYRNLGFSFDGELLKIFGGAFGKKYYLLPIYKIQSIDLNTSPYQQRMSLCSLTIYTASGALHLPYISDEVGSMILDTFMDKVESDHRKWM